MYTGRKQNRREHTLGDLQTMKEEQDITTYLDEIAIAIQELNETLKLSLDNIASVIQSSSR